MRSNLILGVLALALVYPTWATYQRDRLAFTDYSEVPRLFAGFTPETIGEALSTREFMADLREAGAVTGGPAPFSKVHRSQFLQSLDRIINAVKRGKPA